MSFLLTKKENPERNPILNSSNNEVGFSSITLNGNIETFRIEPKKIFISSLVSKTVKNEQSLPIQVEISENTRLQLRLENISNDFRVEFGTSQKQNSAKSTLKLFSQENKTNDLKISSNGENYSVLDCSVQLSPNETTQEIEAKSESCTFLKDDNEIVNAQIDLSIPQFWKEGSSSDTKSSFSRFSSRSKKGHCDFWCQITRCYREPVNSYVVGSCGEAYTYHGIRYCRDRIRVDYRCGASTTYCSSEVWPCP